jgi:peptide/nickel transport system permease protein
MLGLVARRLAIAIPLVFVVTTLTFWLAHLISGDPAHTILGTGASAAQYAAEDHKLGWDDPLPVQYGHFLSQLAQGTLGSSWVTGQDVRSTIVSALPVTVLLALGATLVSLIFGVGFGILSALRGGWSDRVASGASGMLLAVPGFWAAVFLVLVFAIKLRWLPANGYVTITSDPGMWLQYMILPVLALSLPMIAGVLRQTRSAMRRTLAEDYIRTLLASGIGRRSIIFKHALRNAIGPVLTVVGLQFIGAFGGAVIIEQIFALPGVGHLTINAVDQSDLPVLEGVVIATAFVVVLINLLFDILAAWATPRSRLS